MWGKGAGSRLWLWFDERMGNSTSRSIGHNPLLSPKPCACPLAHFESLSQKV